jgi:hypothetical protein
MKDNGMPKRSINIDCGEEGTLKELKRMLSNQ